MGKRGRPTRLTPELIALIAANVELPMPFKFAVEREGIHETTGYEWLNKGEAGEADYVDFYLAVTRARANAVAKLTQHTLSGGRGSMGAQFHLERRFREYFGPTQRIEHAGHDGGSVKIETNDISKMSDEELAKLAGFSKG